MLKISKFTHIAGNMSALLGMQDWNSISLQVISFGNIFLPFVFVVTLQMDKNMSGQCSVHVE